MLAFLTPATEAGGRSSFDSASDLPIFQQDNELIRALIEKDTVIQHLESQIRFLLSQRSSNAPSTSGHPAVLSVTDPTSFSTSYPNNHTVPTSSQPQPISGSRPTRPRMAEEQRFGGPQAFAASLSGSPTRQGSPLRRVPTEARRFVDLCVAHLMPSAAEIQVRQEVLERIKTILKTTLGAQVVAVGPVAGHAFLHTDPIEISAFLCAGQERTWIMKVGEVLFRAMDHGERSIASRGAARGAEGGPALTQTDSVHSMASVGISADDRRLIHAVQLTSGVDKQIACIVDSREVRIGANDLEDLCLLALVEDVNDHVKQDHLFKRALLLAHAWWTHCAPHFSFANSLDAVNAADRVATDRASASRPSASPTRAAMQTPGRRSGGVTRAQSEGGLSRLGGAVLGRITSRESLGALHESLSQLHPETSKRAGQKGSNGTDSTCLHAALRARLPWRATVTLLVWVFSRRGPSIHDPLEALAWMLTDMSQFDWNHYALSIDGPIPLSVAGQQLHIGIGKHQPTEQVTPGINGNKGSAATHEGASTGNGSASTSRHGVHVQQSSAAFSSLLDVQRLERHQLKCMAARGQHTKGSKRAKSVGSAGSTAPPPPPPPPPGGDMEDEPRSQSSHIQSAARRRLMNSSDSTSLRKAALRGTVSHGDLSRLHLSPHRTPSPTASDAYKASPVSEGQHLPSPGSFTPTCSRTAATPSVSGLTVFQGALNIINPCNPAHNMAFDITHHAFHGFALLHTRASSDDAQFVGSILQQLVTRSVSELQKCMRLVPTYLPVLEAMTPPGHHCKLQHTRPASSSPTANGRGSLPPQQAGVQVNASSPRSQRLKPRTQSQDSQGTIDSSAVGSDEDEAELLAMTEAVATPPSSSFLDTHVNSRSERVPIASRSPSRPSGIRSTAIPVGSDAMSIATGLLRSRLLDFFRGLPGLQCVLDDLQAGVTAATRLKADEDDVNSAHMVGMELQEGDEEDKVEDGLVFDSDAELDLTSRKAPGSAEHDHSQTSRSNSTGSYGVLAGSMEDVRKQIDYCSFLLDCEVTTPTLLSLTENILREKKTLPVGEIGKLLQEATSNPNLSTILKDQYGGTLLGFEEQIEQIERQVMVNSGWP